MVWLLVKDVRIQSKFIALGFVFVGFVFFLLGVFEGLPLSVPAAIFSHFLIVVASKADEKNNNGRLLASFPLRRKDIVTAKYAGIALFMFISFLLTSLWRLLAGIVLPARELPWFSAESMIMTVFLLFVFYAIYFPLFFALGSRLVQVLDLIVIFAVGGAVLIALRIMEWSNLPLGSLLHRLPVSDNLSVLLWMLGASFILLLLSWCLSLYVYNNKNL